MTRKMVRPRLTPEQEALIPVYREKWQNLGRLSQSCDRAQATQAIRALYQLHGLPHPKIMFIDRPQDGYRDAFIAAIFSIFPQTGITITSLKQQLKFAENATVYPPNIAEALHKDIDLAATYSFGFQARKRYLNKFKELAFSRKKGTSLKSVAAQKHEIIQDFFPSREDYEAQKERANLIHSVDLKIEYEWLANLYRELNESLKLDRYFWIGVNNTSYRYKIQASGVVCLGIDTFLSAIAKLDYGVSVLGFPYEPTIWDTLYSLAMHCGLMIFPYEKTCIICDRATDSDSSSGESNFC